MHDEHVIEWQVVDVLREIEHAETHDMYDRTRVTEAVADLGYYEAAGWLAANRHLYFKMLARARALRVFEEPVAAAFAAEPAMAAPRGRALAVLVR